MCMTCKQCGSVVADDSLFCPYCGTALSTPEDTSQEAISFATPQEAQPAAPQFKTCPMCGASMDASESICPMCGLSANSESSSTPITPEFPAETHEKIKTKKRHPVAITFAIIAGVLVVALLAGLLTNWFGFYGPTAKIIRAANKTIEAGSMSMKVTLKDGNQTKKGTFELELDADKRHLTFVVANDDDEIVFAIYKGYLLEYYSSERYGSGYEKEDISDKLDEFFDALEEVDEKKDMDFEDLLDELGVLDKVEDHLNIKKLEKSI